MRCPSAASDVGCRSLQHMSLNTPTEPEPRARSPELRKLYTTYVPNIHNHRLSNDPAVNITRRTVPYGFTESLCHSRTPSSAAHHAVHTPRLRIGPASRPGRTVYKDSSGYKAPAAWWWKLTLIPPKAGNLWRPRGSGFEWEAYP